MLRQHENIFERKDPLRQKGNACNIQVVSTNTLIMHFQKYSTGTFFFIKLRVAQVFISR